MADHVRQRIEEYRVELDAYSGPLDLLLYLVRRNEVDLHHIPVAKLTDQFLEHLKRIEQIDVDHAGEFLVMAATLLEIKSQLLMPRPESDDPEADGPTDASDPADPRFELVQQLLAYKQIKDAANALEQRRSWWEARFPARPSKARRPAASGAEPAQPGLPADADPNLEAADDPEAAPAADIDLEDANILDLCEAFARMLDSIGAAGATHDVVYDDTPIDLHAEDIVDRLTREGALSLKQLLAGRTHRTEMIGLFLATLELVRQRRASVTQDADTGEIQIDLRPDAPDAPDAADAQGQPETDADWRDPETGEMQYDWPSEEHRRRAQRRDWLRERRRQREAGELTDEVDDDAPDRPGPAIPDALDDAFDDDFDQDLDDDLDEEPFSLDDDDDDDPADRGQDRQA